MADSGIFRPDEYKHNNRDNAIVDSDGVRGGRRKVADREALYGLVVKADQLKENVTVVRILSDSENGGGATEVLLVDATRIGLSAGWVLYSAGGSPSTGVAGFEVRAYSPSQVVVSIPKGLPRTQATIDNLLRMALVPKAPEPTSYDPTPLTASNPTANGITFLPASTQQLEINELATTSGGTNSFTLLDTSDNSESSADVSAAYTGAWFRFTRANGSKVEATWGSTSQTITL